MEDRPAIAAQSTDASRRFLPAAPSRILLVEDDSDLREALSDNLRLHGFDVVEVETGAAFRRAVQTLPIDAAVIDVNLPDASGFDLARELGGSPDRPGIVILTARSGRGDRLQGYSDGADLYLTKPVDNDELVLALRNLSRRVAEARDAAAVPADEQPAWRLDTARSLLFSPDDRVLVLSGREVMLLELFARAGGTPLSRAYLGSAMGYGAPGPNRRALDATLRRLKQKATQRGVDLPILNVHGVGVRFVGGMGVVG